MNLKIACQNILDQMAAVIAEIDDADFIKPSSTLSGSTVGQHFRHAIEFFECLISGADKGSICYDQREHDRNIETSRVLALEVIRRIKQFIVKVPLDQKLTLVVNYDVENNEGQIVESNISREIVYNIEHVVHHMALVKIGLKELIPSFELPADFGVAVSTMKYQKTQV